MNGTHQILACMDNVISWAKSRILQRTTKKFHLLFLRKFANSKCCKNYVLCSSINRM